MPQGIGVLSTVVCNTACYQSSARTAWRAESFTSTTAVQLPATLKEQPSNGCNCSTVALATYTVCIAADTTAAHRLTVRRAFDATAAQQLPKSGLQYMRTACIIAMQHQIDQCEAPRGRPFSPSHPRVQQLVAPDNSAVELSCQLAS
jgi:hypothetical protein